MKRSLKTILSMALAVALILSMGASAFAESPQPTYTDTGVFLSKKLSMPIDTEKPVKEFSFNITCADNTAPVLTADNISFTAGTTYTEVDKLHVAKLGSQLKIGELTHAGLFEYTVTENCPVSGTETKVEETSQGNMTKTMTYSAESYTVKVYVKNTTDGLEVSSIVVIKKGDPEKKIDDTTGTIENNDFTFNNKYFIEIDGEKDDDGKPDPKPGDKHALGLEKEVKGTYGSHEKLFDFTVTVGTNPMDTATSKNYTIYKSDKSVRETGALTLGAAKEIQLKHGDYFRITDKLLQGTEFTFTEKDYSKETNPNDKYETENSKGDGGLTATGRVTADNKVVFTNTNNTDDTDPTGISMNNGAYIALISVAVLGIFLFLFLNKRRHNQEG